MLVKYCKSCGVVSQLENKYALSMMLKNIVDTQLEERCSNLRCVGDDICIVYEELIPVFELIKYREKNHHASYPFVSLCSYAGLKNGHRGDVPNIYIGFKTREGNNGDLYNYIDDAIDEALKTVPINESVFHVVLHEKPYSMFELPENVASKKYDVVLHMSVDPFWEMEHGGDGVTSVDEEYAEVMSNLAAAQMTALAYSIINSL